MSSSATSKTAWASPSASVISRRVSEISGSKTNNGNQGNKRRVIIRRSNTLQPSRYQSQQNSLLTHRFDVTSSQHRKCNIKQKSSADFNTDATDLNLMVRGTGQGGQVSSVCSQVEAPRTVDQVRTEKYVQAQNVIFKIVKMTIDLGTEK